jgi:hypothetical protein
MVELITIDATSENQRSAKPLLALFNQESEVVSHAVDRAER